jgi:hypothetical protein
MTWNVVRPAAAIGATTHASMNRFFAFGMYAAIQAQRSETLHLAAI